MKSLYFFSYVIFIWFIIRRFWITFFQFVSWSQSLTDVILFFWLIVVIIFWLGSKLLKKYYIKWSTKTKLTYTGFRRETLRIGVVGFVSKVSLCNSNSRNISNKILMQIVALTVELTSLHMADGLLFDFFILFLS